LEKKGEQLSTAINREGGKKKRTRIPQAARNRMKGQLEGGGKTSFSGGRGRKGGYGLIPKLARGDTKKKKKKVLPLISPM